MAMTLKMEVFSYKSLIMCEFNCFVYPQEHWKQILKKGYVLEIVCWCYKCARKKYIRCMSQ